jgi:hypothetical protein
MTGEINTEKKISEHRKMYHSIFVTALEGGIGYWSTCEIYRWSDGYGKEDYETFYAVIEDEVDGGKYRIDSQTISRGYRLAVKNANAIGWSGEKPPMVVRNEDDWDFDASDADCIVQLGLFGEIVYG